MSKQEILAEFNNLREQWEHPTTMEVLDLLKLVIDRLPDDEEEV